MYIYIIIVLVCIVTVVLTTVDSFSKKNACVNERLVIVVHQMYGTS